MPSLRILPLLLCALFAALPAAAQTYAPDFSVQRFVPAPAANDYAMVESALTLGDWDPQWLLVFDYARNPFSLRVHACGADPCPAAGRTHEYVDTALAVHGSLGLVLSNRYQLALDLAWVDTSASSYHATYPDGTQAPLHILGGTGSAPGDPRLRAKIRLFDLGNYFSTAVAADFTLPLANALAKDFGLGEPSPTFTSKLIGEYHHSRFRIAANLGATFKKSSSAFSVNTGTEALYGLGAAVHITPPLQLGAEVTGTLRFTGSDADDSMEARYFSTLQFSSWQLFAGLGHGLVGTLGVPSWRVFTGLRFGSSMSDAADSDNDGVPYRDDRCPSIAEDFDGYLDADGCPEADNDGDGSDDVEDSCPNTPEDLDGHMDSDGCPDLDNDGDGINDGYDSCPNHPEDFDGDRDEDGCPDSDRDKDGVPDNEDQCPDEPEDTDGFADYDGCPEYDYDGDGIPDDQDYCPEVREDHLEPEPDDGCPLETPTAADIAPIDTPVDAPVEGKDSDGDGFPDDEDQCPNQAEDNVGYREGCPRDRHL